MYQDNGNEGGGGDRVGHETQNMVAIFFYTVYQQESGCE